MKKLVTILFILISYISHAQTYDQPKNYGLEYRRVKVDTVFHPPIANIGDSVKDKASLRRAGAIAFSPTSGLIYSSDGITYNNVVGGGASSWYYSDTIKYYYPVGKIYNSNLHYSIAPILFINGSAVNWAQNNISYNADSGYLDFTYYKDVQTINGYINFIYNTADTPINNEDTWTASQMPGLVANIDFSNLTYVKYGDSTLLVDSVLDKLGSYHYIKGSGTEPSLKYFGAPNGKPYVEFTSGKYLKSTALALSQPFTIYMVMKQNSYTENTGILDFNGVSGTNGLWNKTAFAVTQPYKRALGPVSSVGWSSYAYPYMYNEKWSVFRFSYSGDNDSSKCSVDGSPYIKMYGGTAGMTYFQINNGSSFDVQRIWIVSGKPSDTDDMKMRKYILKESRIKPKPFMISFGTSISFGFNAINTTGTGYIDQTAYHFGIPLFNYAKSGSQLDTGTDNFYYTKKWKAFTALNPQDGWVTIEFGTNDGYGYMTGSPQWKARYKQSVQQLLTYGYNPNHIMLVSRFYTKSSDVSQYNKIDSIINTIAIETGVHFLNVDSFMRNNGGVSLSSSDSLHPATAGHNAIASFTIRKMFEWSNGSLNPVFPQNIPSSFLPVYLKDERDVLSQTWGNVQRGTKIYCSDCTATDASTGVEQTWNGSAWKNSW